MKHRQSGKKLIVRLFCVMIAATLLCFVVCGVYSLRSVQKELRYCNEAALDVFFQGLQFIAEDLEDFGELIYEKSSLFSMLDLQSISIEQRSAAEMSLRQLCRSRTTACTAIYLFQRGDGFRFYSVGEAFLGNNVLTADTVRTMAAVRTFWESQESDSLQRWVLFDSDSAAVLMHAVQRGSLCACVMIDLNAYIRTHQTDAGGSGIAYAFYNEDRVLTETDYVRDAGLTLTDLQQANGDTRHVRGGYLVLHSRVSDELNIGLCGMISLTGVWANLRLYSALLVGTLLMISVIFLAIYNLMNRMLIYPLDRISAASRQVAAGSAEIELQPESIQELDAIQNALKGLVEQKVSLERESINQAYQKEHAMLQYYQLQTRSHFFLNCLKSIYNMTARGEQEKTQRVVSLFSNHLRYVFHDGLSLIPIRAELDEVNDYFHIIELERSDHILLTQEVDPELMDFPVPPLVIQTFLENFNKHNAQGERILRFSIRIDRVEMEEQPYVRIRLSDNGVGYEKDALKDMGRRDELFSQYHVGIQNLLRRLDILYQKRQQIAFYNNPGGGACSVLYLPCEHAEQSASEAAEIRAEGE